MKQNEQESTRQRRGQLDPLLEAELRRRQQEVDRQRHRPQALLGFEAHQVAGHRGKPLELLSGRKYEGFENAKIVQKTKR